jgi:hypothetical protein
LALSDHEIEAPLGQGVMPAITLALRHLANSSFLHDYRLRHAGTASHPHPLTTTSSDHFPLLMMRTHSGRCPRALPIRRLGQ